MRRTIVIALGLIVGSTAQTSSAHTALPNLVPQRPHNLLVADADEGTGTDAIRLATTSENHGAGHLELLGFPPTGPEATSAQQCVAWEGRVCEEREQVGTFEWHAEHQHWHLNDYARYDLRALTPAGVPDMSPGGVLATSGKISFCLLDSGDADSAEPPADDPFAQTGFYKGCTGLLQGISRGWADTYGSYLDGQQVVIDAIPDGRYALMITVNPERILRESNYDDNTSHAIIELKDDDVRVVG